MLVSLSHTMDFPSLLGKGSCLLHRYFHFERLQALGAWRKVGSFAKIFRMELLQQLVRIPSVNPDNAPGTDRTHEHELAQFVAYYLRELGATVELEEVAPRRPNLIARFAPLDGRPRVLFGPHLDTVGVSGMSIDPFAAEIRDGRLYGRGACDTKGPMAAMLTALENTADILPSLPVAVDFVAFMGEESSQHGSRHFAARHGHHYSFAIVGEPTALSIVHRTKGSLWATLLAQGRAAHSSQPHLGSNAVMAMAQTVLALDEQLPQRLAPFVDPLLGAPTLNIGTFYGGTRPNIVPDSATVELDIRTTPALAAAGGAFPVLRELLAAQPVEIEHWHENPPLATDTNLPLLQALLACPNCTGLAGAPWFSDASHLAAAGIPAVCLGPGSIDQAHTQDEYIELAQLQAAIELFTQWIVALS